MAVRVVSHVAVWVAVLVPTLVILSRGWIAVGDDAAISIRAFQSLSLHPPLTGMLTTAGTMSHPLYDPGPLLFWLLAIPTRLDPVHGALWGAAVLSGVVLSLAVEAVWSTRAWIGCAAIGLVALDLLWRTPVVFSNLTWNAYFPLPFFMATMALAWVVATGRLGWWPALIVVASVAAQSHLLFTVPSVALSLLAPAIAVASGGRPKRFRWLVIGAALAVVCWLAPLLQTFGSHGNLTALVNDGSGGGGVKQTLGLAVGLKLVAKAGSVSPIWLAHQPVNFFQVLGSVNANSSLYGLFILGLLAVIATWALLRRHRMLSALALVTLISSVSMAFSYSQFPKKNSLSLAYLIPILWVIGIVMWVVAIWVVTLAVVTLLESRASVRLTPSGRPWRTTGVVLGTVAMVSMVAVGAAGIPRALAPERYDPNFIVTQTRATAVDQISRAVEHSSHRGPVVVSVRSAGARGANAYNSFVITEGVGWRLEADGWEPGLYGVETAYTGLVPARRPASFHVSLDGYRVESISLLQCHAANGNCR